MPDPTAVQRFLDTWAPHCGAPRYVFEGQFRVMLKAVRARGLHIGFHVLSVAQLGREASKRIRKQTGDKMTTHSEDVRGSHEYSADADFMYVLMPDPQSVSSMVHLMVLKSRFGSALVFGLFYCGRLCFWCLGLRYLIDSLSICIGCWRCWCFDVLQSVSSEGGAVVGGFATGGAVA